MQEKILDIIVNFIKIYFPPDKNQKEKANNTRKKISAFYHDVSECLSKMSGDLSLGNEPTAQWGRLRTYASELPSIVHNHILKDEEVYLHQLLIKIGIRPPTDEDIGLIKNTSEVFAAKARTITQRSEPEKSRRSFFIIGTSLLFGLGAALIPEPRSKKTGDNSHVKQTDVNPVIQDPNYISPCKPLPILWNMHTFLHANVKETILYKAPEQVCELVRTMTKGSFDITLTREGNTTEILERVKSRSIECGYSGIYYDPRYEVLFFGCAIPFGLTPQEQTAWLHYRKNNNSKYTYVQEIYRKINKERNRKLPIIPFPAGATGSQMGGWFREEVRTEHDLIGKTIRVPGLGAEVMERMGMNIYNKGYPHSITESIQDLKRGKIDAVEWTGPYDDLKLGLHKAADFYYYHQCSH